MDDKTLILAPEELAETQSPPAENWFTDGQLPSDDRQQLHQLLAALLRMYHALPAPLRGALIMIGAAPGCTREDPMWCIDLINQAVAQFAEWVDSYSSACLSFALALSFRSFIRSLKVSFFFLSFCFFFFVVGAA